MRWTFLVELKGLENLIPNTCKPAFCVLLKHGCHDLR